MGFQRNQVDLRWWRSKAQGSQVYEKDRADL